MHLAVTFQLGIWRTTLTVQAMQSPFNDSLLTRHGWVLVIVTRACARLIKLLFPRVHLLSLACTKHERLPAYLLPGL